MSIDYDRLKDLLNECTTGQWQSHDYEPDPYCYPGATRFVIAADWDRVEIAEGQAGPSSTSPEYARKASDFALMATAKDTARDLLRLRDGMEKQIIHLEVLRATAEARGRHDFARLLEARVADLTGLLNGDTE